jgi:DNA phosphorothioation-dependent restriction protein DptG
MEAIKTIFLEVAHNKRSVSDLINVLTDKNVANNIGEDERNAYQAFCCALLAKEAKHVMQKGQYIQEYNLFIQLYNNLFF